MDGGIISQKVGEPMAYNVPGVTDVARPFAQCAEPVLSWRVPSESFRERSGYTMLADAAKSRNIQFQPAPRGQRLEFKFNCSKNLDIFTIKKISYVRIIFVDILIKNL
jgi:hypothetical protein